MEKSRIVPTLKFFVCFVYFVCFVICLSSLLGEVLEILYAREFSQILHTKLNEELS